jgi:hypothetical protein
MTAFFESWFGSTRHGRSRATAKPARKCAARTVKNRVARFELCDDRNMLSGMSIMASSLVPSAISSQTAMVAQLVKTAPAITNAAITGNFVSSLYQAILNRQADSAGLTIFTTMINNGTPISTVVNAFWQSAEHRGIQVDGFFQTYLKRASDPNGRNFWVNAMLTGSSEEVVRAAFVTSSEYIAKNPLTGNYVGGLYRDVMGRVADLAGFNFWNNALINHTSTTLEVAQAFIASHERHVKLVDSSYLTYLNRKADTVGETSLAAALDGGLLNEQSLAVTFLTSTEYVNAHPIP